MALSRTDYAVKEPGSVPGTSAFVTSSYAVPANSLLIAHVFASAYDFSGGSVSSLLTIADSLGLTWTSRATHAGGDAYFGGRVWTAPCVAGGNPTLTLDCGSNAMDTYLVGLTAYTGQHASPIGVTASGNDADGDGAGSITLSGAPATSSEVHAVLSVISSTGTATATTGTGWTQRYSASSALIAWLGFHGQTRTGSTSTAVSWNDVYAGAGTPYLAMMSAIEIIAAAADAKPPRLMLLGVG